jgi:ABC-type lipoprotein export system ATPase subunit
MANSVRFIKAVGIHKRFDLEQSFQPGVNIIYGKNGTGKTTLLHIIANILNGDFERFAFIPFETIEVHLDDGQRIKLRNFTHAEDNKVEAYVNKVQVANFSVSEVRERLGQRSTVRSEQYLRAFQSLKAILPTAYFPAFRTLIEASSDDDAFEPYTTRMPSRAPDRQTINPSLFARRFFGDFVPWINYPSPVIVGQRLATEMQQALNVVANTDRRLLSTAFLDIFATLSSESNPTQEQPEPILDKINSLFSRLESSSIISDPSAGEEVYSKLRELVLSFRVRVGREDVYVPILEVYKRALEERASIQEKSFATLKTYLNSVNRFLDGKELSLRKTPGLPVVQVKFHETELYSPIGALSPGERQIVTLIYAATHMSTQKVVLVDEPEISLHIDWQSSLISEMVAQLQDRQIITCTHSPMIAANYEEQMAELEIMPTDKKRIPNEDAVYEIEEL